MCWKIVDKACNADILISFMQGLSVVPKTNFPWYLITYVHITPSHCALEKAPSPYIKACEYFF
ncbi:hypothetical protein AF72_07145 [Xylella taiwanensis]|uniref:Uncharacterized protein n=1 Tax=Xylella taiwanensis TaxID=1444770 RepID=Z9JJH8_9GAMM|nr:hypothetical protein AF72_07145 [Xylella taiwanensis]